MYDSVRIAGLAMRVCLQNKREHINLVYLLNRGSVENNKHFFKTSSELKVAEILSRTIEAKLAGGHSVLWLLSGGSAIKVAVLAAGRLAGKDVSRLTVSLADERYGPAGHQASNWKQLIDAGFRLDGAILRQLLKGHTPAQTVAGFEKLLTAAAGSYKIALLGMGADGHTAGILPESPALNEAGLVSFYQGPDYQRLTLSGHGLKNLDEAVLFTTGDNKLSAIRDLATELPANDQPAQIIKQIPRWSVYNDLLGEEV